MLGLLPTDEKIEVRHIGDGRCLECQRHKETLKHIFFGNARDQESPSSSVSLDPQQISSPIFQMRLGFWPQDTSTKENFGLCGCGLIHSAMESMATSE